MVDVDAVDQSAGTPAARQVTNPQGVKRGAPSETELRANAKRIASSGLSPEEREEEAMQVQKNVFVRGMKHMA